MVAFVGGEGEGVRGISGILTGDREPSDPDDSNIMFIEDRGFVGDGEEKEGERGGEDGEGVRGGGEASLVNDVCEGVGEPILTRFKTLK